MTTTSAITIIIPAYRPGHALPEIVRDIISQTAPGELGGILVVDDGSEEAYRPVFESLQALPQVTVLRHAVNLGKGAALKTAFNHALLTKSSAGVVTADADGQHLPADILKVARTFAVNPTSLVLGCRAFDRDVPLRSKFGNSLTAHVTRFLLGKKIADTQTGLRAIPTCFLGDLLRLNTTGYDFEMDMLITAVNKGHDIIQTVISTVYLDGNCHSHFNPLLDSLAIYYVFLRHVGNALATAAIDYLVFALALLATESFGLSLVLGRIFAGTFNFCTAKILVFKSSTSLLRELCLYTALVSVFTALSYGIIIKLNSFGAPILLVKALVELTIFLIAFVIQRAFIFRDPQERSAATDWDGYYSSRHISSPTRWITKRLIFRLMDKHINAQIKSIIEFGGGDSFIYAAMAKKFPDALYTVVDNSSAGIEKLASRYNHAGLRALCADILQPLPDELQKADFIFSVGLIEHFDEKGTRRCIEAHLESLRTGGFLLLTYPVSTLPYRIIRSAAERLGIWAFPDERPLTSGEVLSVLSGQVCVLRVSKNWLIGLTQEIVLAKKEAGP
ncbi:glycosyltransferase [Desulfovibrio sp. OttesenSCG-928-G11]|nr:glycosyltransferase [Desulfovibrio sp. OttesenSCG-928-G11]